MREKKKMGMGNGLDTSCPMLMGWLVGWSLQIYKGEEILKGKQNSVLLHQIQDIKGRIGLDGHNLHNKIIQGLWNSTLCF